MTERNSFSSLFHPIFPRICTFYERFLFFIISFIVESYDKTSDESWDELIITKKQLADVQVSDEISMKTFEQWSLRLQWLVEGSRKFIRGSITEEICLEAKIEIIWSGKNYSSKRKLFILTWKVKENLRINVSNWFDFPQTFLPKFFQKGLEVEATKDSDEPDDVELANWWFPERFNEMFKLFTRLEYLMMLSSNFMTVHLTRKLFSSFDASHPFDVWPSRLISLESNSALDNVFGSALDSLATWIFTDFYYFGRQDPESFLSFSAPSNNIEANPEGKHWNGNLWAEKKA